jgi:hypothetical protein
VPPGATDCRSLQRRRSRFPLRVDFPRWCPLEGRSWRWCDLLIAQAAVENMTLVSNERMFDAFGVTRLW